MAKKIITITLIALILVGCAPQVDTPKIESKPPEDNLVVHIIQGKVDKFYTENDLAYIEIDNEKIKVLSKDEFNQMTPGNYIIAYNENKELLKAEKQSEIITKQIVIKQAFTQDIYTPVKETIIDINNDGQPDKIVLSVDAEKDDNGVFMWDDGQNWKLKIVMNYLEEAETREEYNIFEGYVQLGNLDYVAYFENEVFSITTIDSRTANLTIKTYEYDIMNQSFNETVDLNKNNIINYSL